jgi:hypothetical protein
VNRQNRILTMSQGSEQKFHPDKSPLFSRIHLLQMQTYRASGQVAEETRPPQNPLFHVFIQIGLLCRFNVNIVYFWCCTAAPVDLFQKV